MVTKRIKRKGLSLHAGLNLVSGTHYGGWTGELSACEFDAEDMAALARAQGLKPTVLLTKKATRAALLARIRAATKALTSDDLFFLSFSGHGDQVNDGIRSSSKATTPASTRRSRPAYRRARH